MNTIRNDIYTKYYELECRFWLSGNNYILQANYNEALLNKLGFTKYEDIELKDKMYKKVLTADVDNAYQVRTYCKYKGFSFFVESFHNGLYTILPLEEAMKYFNDFPKHGYDPVYTAKENEVEEIWEERTPKEGFKFEVNSIVYLKHKS